MMPALHLPVLQATLTILLLDNIAHAGHPSSSFDDDEYDVIPRNALQFKQSVTNLINSAKGLSSDDTSALPLHRHHASPSAFPAAVGGRHVGVFPSSPRHLNLDLDIAEQARRDLDSVLFDKGALPAVDTFSRKRKWSQFASWGKRTPGADFDHVTKWRSIASSRSDADQHPVKATSNQGAGNSDILANDGRWKQMDQFGNQMFGNDKRWQTMNLWGKRQFDVDAAKALHQHNSDKKWSNVGAWGKRGDMSPMSRSGVGPVDAMDLHELWQRNPLFDKRQVEIMDDDLEKKWSQMSSWGKRSDNGGHFVADDDNNARPIIDEVSGGVERLYVPHTDKRWANMGSWGKRWANMGSWGKRDDGGQNPVYNKKWANVSSWGKRSGSGGLGGKRWANMSSWGKRWANMSSWGKRSLSSNDDISKRWANMGSWGKRSIIGEDEDASASSAANKPVKKWTTASFWGKRGVKPPGILFRKKWVRRPLRRSSWGLWGKRPSWSQVGFTSWGKRGAGGDLDIGIDPGQVTSGDDVTQHLSADEKQVNRQPATNKLES